MTGRLAIKRLTKSDLTFFEWHFRHRNAGNQKAINLNADVFKQKLFPMVDVVASESNDRLGVDLWIGGSAGAGIINLQRKIIKGSSYKNWRLDGEFIHDPEGDPGRFRILEPGDVVAFGFEGKLAPHTVTIILLAKAAPEDKPVLDQLDQLLDRRPMLEVTPDQLRAACRRASVADSHPISRLLTDEDIVEASVGIWPAVEQILRVRERIVTPQDFQKGRESAEETGMLGEQLVARYLEDLCDAGGITDYEWTSSQNAIAPYDFHVCRDESWEKWEIKTTTGNFSRSYYLPRSELFAMAYGDEHYRVGRVYGADQKGARMRLSGDLTMLGREILNSCGGFPSGVEVNGVTVSPTEDQFGEDIALVPPDDVAQ